MPRRKYRSTTIKEELYNKVEDKARELNKSVSRYISDCLENSLTIQGVPANG